MDELLLWLANFCRDLLGVLNHLCSLVVRDLCCFTHACQLFIEIVSARTRGEMRGVLPPKLAASPATVPVAGLVGALSSFFAGLPALAAAIRAQNSSVRRVSAASLASGLCHNRSVVYSSDD